MSLSGYNNLYQMQLFPSRSEALLNDYFIPNHISALGTPVSTYLSTLGGVNNQWNDEFEIRYGIDSNGNYYYIIIFDKVYTSAAPFDFKTISGSNSYSLPDNTALYLVNATSESNSFTYTNAGAENATSQTAQYPLSIDRWYISGSSASNKRGLKSVSVGNQYNIGYGGEKFHKSFTHTDVIKLTPLDNINNYSQFDNASYGVNTTLLAPTGSIYYDKINEQVKVRSKNTWKSFVTDQHSGSINLTGSLQVSGSMTTMNFISGSQLYPTASVGDSLRPTFSASVDGQYIFGSGSQGYKLWVWLGGAWRSGSLI